MASQPSQNVHLDNRLALTVPEAAKAIGVSERHLRDLLPDIPHLRMGNRVVIPIDQFRDWLARMTTQGRNRVDEVVEKTLREFKER